ncbi:MAG: cytochrome C oxidase subunit II [Myxococcota bacterium]|jgi:cytochrome c oxidase subunit 2|nr:cytochrome C oxidase subunit II [Myxococcota bacterium]
MIEPYVAALSTYAKDIDDVIMLITLLVGFWFLLAQGALLGFCWVYRKRDGQKAQYITGEEKSQMRWVSIPLVLIVCCDIYIALADGPVWAKVKEDLPPAERKVRVIAQQWAWTFVDAGPDGQLDTADDITTMTDLHVEVGKLYHFELQSLDVIHGFSVPVFRLKQDIIPGRTIIGWFEATGTGTYDIQCTEICGIGHGLMPGRIIIETAEQHASWLAEHSELSVASNTLPQAAQE